MQTSRSFVQLPSKFAAVYNKLFQGYAPQEISPNEDPEAFWGSLLVLDVNRQHLSSLLGSTTSERCLNDLKPFLNTLFSACLVHSRALNNSDVRKMHALETLRVFVRSILAKNLAGWEVMEIFAGGVSNSDTVFMDFATTIDTIMGDSTAPAELRHAALELAITYMCSVNQLSPGAYFLRRDLSKSLTDMIKSSDTKKYAFEITLLFGILANFHRSDAGKLNPYVERIRGLQDQQVMREICWAASFACNVAIKAYQDISDDSPPTISTTLGSMFTSLRPDRALLAKPVDLPRALFQNQPIEAAVILLPIFEFIHVNPLFFDVLAEYLGPNEDSTLASSSSPPPLTILTLSSYLTTHASSLSSPRATAYAHLSLDILLAFAGNEKFMGALSLPGPSVRLCRQRLPVLPVLQPQSPPICALLDCCVLWLRHNLHLRLEVHLYTIVIRICTLTLSFLIKEHVRLEYHWPEFLKAIVGVLSFLVNKSEGLVTSGGIELLVRETIQLLDLALFQSDAYLPTPRAIHEFIYELVRAMETLKKQEALLKGLEIPMASRHRRTSSVAFRTHAQLSRILSTLTFYEGKITAARSSSATSALRVVAKELEKDGLHGGQDQPLEELPKYTTDVLGFIRFACVDGLALMP